MSVPEPIGAPQPPQPQPIVRSREGLYKQSFWLFGVIVGLAIGEVLRGTIPHVIAAPPSVVRYPRITEGIRIFVFLTVTIRFYLGAATFFDDAFVNEITAKFPKKNFGSDYLIGIIHFVLFFAWAVTVDIHPKAPLPAIPLGLFPSFLGLILIYDVVWYFACREYDTRRLIKRWMLVNVTTVVLGGGSYGLTLLGLLVLQYPVRRATLCAEVAGFFWVVLASGIDLAEIVSDRKYFARWFSGILGAAEVQ